MWPSEAVASRIYDIANVILIISLAAGVISTGFVVWMGNVKENYLQIRLGNATERAGKAEESAAELEVEALSLRKELLRQGPRENLVSGKARTELVDALKPYRGQSVEVRYGLNPNFLPGTSAEPSSPDAIGLAKSLNEVLKDALWSVPPVPLLSNWQGEGINVQISPNASRSTVKAAEELIKSLHEVPLAAVGPWRIKVADNPRKGTMRVFLPVVPGGPAIETPLPPQTDETIVLVVLAHPK